MKHSEIYRDILDDSGSQEDNSISTEDVNIVTDPMMEEFKSLIESYEKWKSLIDEKNIDDSRKRLSKAEKLIEGNFSHGALNQLFNELEDRDSIVNDPSQDLFITAAANKADLDPISIEGDSLSELSGLDGIGYRNRSNLIIEGDVGETLLRESVDGDVIINGNVGAPLAQEMYGGRVELCGDYEGLLSAGEEMYGGELILNGNVSAAGSSMKGGHIRVKGDAKTLGRNMRAGEIGSEGEVENVADRIEGGIAWVNDNAENVGNGAKGGLVYVSGNAEEVGRMSEDGEIYVEGEIENIGDRCGADVYQWNDGNWELVHKGEDWKSKRSNGKKKKKGKARKSGDISESYNEEFSNEFNEIIEEDESIFDDLEDTDFYRDIDMDGYSEEKESENEFENLDDSDDSDLNLLYNEVPEMNGGLSG